MSAELVIAAWLVRHGVRVLEFEPTTSDGKRPDLLVGSASEECFIEVVTPAMPASSIDRANTRLHVGLERVESGLTVEVSGYNAHARTQDPDQDAISVVTNTQVDDVVSEFRQKATRLDTSELPATVVQARPGQPVAITAVDYDPTQPGTFVMVSWGESGLVPDVKRLVGIIRKERKHLPEGYPGAILVDLSRWSDFRGADYYLVQAEKQLARHQLPAFIGTFVWQGGAFEPESRRCLHRDEPWTTTKLGRLFARLWTR
ncbi:MAG: hypothetical protein GEU90_18890 [Gemmatimonas sp.]|nr:hypothetical protein [Gemmatimonas sp.]